MNINNFFSRKESENMKKTKLKTYITTTLMLLCTAGMLAGCGGNKADSNFTKEEKDEIDDAFSADERKELEAELNGDSQESKKKSNENVTYNDTITIDPLAHISLVLTGTLPDNAELHVVSDDISWEWDSIYDSDFITCFDYAIDGYTMSYSYENKLNDAMSLAQPFFTKEDGMNNVGDTVTLSIEWRHDSSYPQVCEENIQKNIELARTSADIQIVADEKLTKNIIVWNDLTDEEKEAFIARGKEIARQLRPDILDDDIMNTMEAVSEVAFVKENDYIPENQIAIGFKISDEQILYACYAGVQVKVSTDEIDMGFVGSFIVDPSVTDMNELTTAYIDQYITYGDKPKFTPVEFNTLQ